MSKKTLAIDFDGVLHKYSRGYQDGTIYDEPIEGAKEALKSFVDAGWRVVIFTTRLNDEVNKDVFTQYDAMLTWLFNNGFSEGIHYHELTGKKPLAKYYIDDRAVRFTNWDLTIKFLEDDSRQTN